MSDSRNVRVFISYSHEDVGIAEVVRDELKAINSDRVEVFLDRWSIPSGHRWDTEIMTKLGEADWLVFIYTGRNRRSYDYCGFEIGVFTNSRGLKSTTDIQKSSHVVCLHDTQEVPALLAMIQNRKIISFQRGHGTDADEEKLERHFYLRSPMAQFLEEFYGFPRGEPIRPGTLPMGPDRTSRLGEQPNLGREIAERCKRIALAFQDGRKQDPISERFYQVRMEIHVPGPVTADRDRLPPETRIVASLDTFNLLGVSPDPDENGELALGWVQMQEALVRNMENQAWLGKIEDDILDAIHQRNLRSPEVTFRAADEQLYRPLLSRQVIFRGGGRIFSAIFVRTLPRQFAGDESTSSLLIGLILASRFRFHFVEDLDCLLEERLAEGTSETLFNLACRQLQYDIERMEQESSEFGMSSPAVLCKLFGPRHRALIEDFYSSWLSERGELFAVIDRRLEMATEVDKETVRQAVARFVQAMEPRNATFLSMCVDKYGRHVKTWLAPGAAAQRPVRAAAKRAPERPRLVSTRGSKATDRIV